MRTRDTHSHSIISTSCVFYSYLTTNGRHLFEALYPVVEKQGHIFPHHGSLGVQFLKWVGKGIYFLIDI